MIQDVSVKIEQVNNFHSFENAVPLLFYGYSTSEVPYTICTSIEEVQNNVPENSRILQWANVLFLQENAPQEIAICCSLGGAINGVSTCLNENWRQLLICSESEEENTVESIAQFLQTYEDKVLFASIENVEQLSPELNFDRLFLVLDPEMQGAAAAVVGASSGLAMGGFSYKNLQLNAIDAQNISTEQLEQTHEAGGVVPLEKAGDVVTSEGMATSGEYLDVVDARDIIVSRLVSRTQSLLNQEKKVPYDNRGIAQLEGICLGVLSDAYAEGLIAQKDDGQPDFSVSYASRSQTKAEDRAQRRYVEGRFTFTLAGAVHEAVITGSVLI